MTDILQDIPTMQEFVINQCAATAAGVFLQVATQILGRPPVDGDAKDFCMVSHKDHPGIECLTYKGHCYGRFRTEWTATGFNYIFEPITTFA